MKKDIITVLESEHRTVEELFEKVLGSKEEDRDEIFAELKEELEAHARAEEEMLYPKMEKFVETETISKHSVEEHSEVKEALAKLESMDSDKPEWMEKVEDLKEDVRHHVIEEEGELFVKMRDLLTKEQMAELAVEFESSKQKFLKAG